MTEPKRYTEDESREAMVRFIKYARMALSDDVGRDITSAADVLTSIRQARRELDYAEAFAVDTLRAKGATWADIGELFGITKQAAQQRYGDRPQP